MQDAPPFYMMGGTASFEARETGEHGNRGRCGTVMVNRHSALCRVQDATPNRDSTICALDQFV